MKYFIEKASSKFAYIQLYEQIRRDIVKGILTYGTKIPSKRLMAEETGVSVITIERAYSILCEEGYVESRAKSGYYVIYQEKDFVVGTEVACRHKPERKNVQHITCEFPFSVLAKTMRRVLSEYKEEILISSPNQGCLELRQAISNYLARNNGMVVDPEQIVIGTGAVFFYGLVVLLFGRDRKFALENPSYEKIQKVYEANGVTCELLKMGRDGILSSELNKSDATVLHITPFHSFPSGVTASASKRQEYLKWSEDRNGYIIEDNFDSELTISKKSEDTVYALSKKERVIYLNTFSKTIAPSTRIAYMILPKHLLERFQEKINFYSCGVPVFEQYVLTELIESGDFERHINRVRRARRKAEKTDLIKNIKIGYLPKAKDEYNNLCKY